MRIHTRMRGFQILGAALSGALLFAASAMASHDQSRTYRVTVFNLTGGQPFTPPIVAAHHRSFHIFERREEASIGVQEIAENGNLDPMLEILEGSNKVSDFAVAVAGDPPPLLPGDSVSGRNFGSTQ